MKITLEEIKTQQNKVTEMIAAFEANQKLSAAFPLTINFPTLNAGEQYIGCIISANGNKREHVILLPDEREETTWQSAMDWASSIGGSLPDRIESAMLFATMKDQFKEEWYWTCDQYAHNDSYAWVQYFNYGNQGNGRKSYEYRARAVRRLSVIE